MASVAVRNLKINIRGTNCDSQLMKSRLDCPVIELSKAVTLMLVTDFHVGDVSLRLVSFLKCWC